MPLWERGAAGKGGAVSERSEKLVSVGHRHWERTWQTGYQVHQSILYLGEWNTVADGDAKVTRSHTQHNAFMFCFRGPAVRWRGSMAPDHGIADIYLDGEFCQSVDAYAPTARRDVVLFEKRGLDNDRIHTLRVVVRKQRNSQASDCYQDVAALEAVEPVIYPVEIGRAMSAEYEKIQAGTKEYPVPAEWKPVANRADPPMAGVILQSGPLREALARNVDYLNRSFASPTYCDGKGWSEWLPASNDGRLLAGAANALRWQERPDMRAIVDTIIDRIESRMRRDGYFDYYPESDSYALDEGLNSERKNYDRVFWTRGLLAAGMAGNPKAYGLVRRMYDWFNSSPYLPRMLMGGNATNGLPGGPLVYLSPVGRREDLVVAMRYYDQDYWMRALARKEPFSLSHYPGERPHCYDLLGIEAFLDEYRATGARKYLDAVRGAWDLYRENHKHVGGATAIMESDLLFAPQTYHFAQRPVGETCGSVFWITINSKLLGLYPDQEKYAAEIEEALYNVILANQDGRGSIRYHTNLEGTKAAAQCQNTCCEVSAAGLISRLPELVFSIASDGLFVHLYTPSAITWRHGGDEVTLSMETRFPVGSEVSMKLAMPRAREMTIRLRVPSWATGAVAIGVNGNLVATGTPGTYETLTRCWANDDRIELSLPAGFRSFRYTGLDQLEGNPDRVALLFGPLLMALVGAPQGEGRVPRVAASAEELPALLRRTAAGSLEFRVEGHQGYVYRPYVELQNENFTCFPVVEPSGMNRT